jgi:hypothetical protein
MLGKLMKYEFRATGRVFLPLFGALLVVSIISRILISLRFQAPSVIGIALSVILIVAVFVITLIITLQRFYKNLLTNEGYLMFTLPVSTDRLIWSKLIVASVWNILSIVIVFIAIGIMAITEFNLADALRCFSELLDSVGIYGGTLAAFIVEFIVLCLTSLLSGILTFYACMSVSLLMNKHRVLFSFVAFLVFNTVGQILLGIGAAAVLATKLPETFMSWDLFTQIHVGQLSMIALNVVVGVVFYILSRYMLKNKLNLE